MSFGLLVIAINIGYLIFSIIAGIVLAKLLKKSAWFQKRSTALLAIVLFLLIFLAPFYDLLIQKGIKTYYEVFDKTYAKIYAYPEKDAEGRVESLGVDKNYGKQSAGYLATEQDFKDFKRGEKVTDFVEYYFFNTFEKDKKDIGYTRVYLSKKELNYKKISGPKEFKARYQILKEISDFWYHKKIKTIFLDRNKNKILAETLGISFPVKDNRNRFRYKYLHWHGANGGYGFSIDDIPHNNGRIYRKIFLEHNYLKDMKK